MLFALCDFAARGSAPISRGALFRLFLLPDERTAPPPAAQCLFAGSGPQQRQVRLSVACGHTAQPQQDLSDEAPEPCSLSKSNPATQSGKRTV